MIVETSTDPIKILHIERAVTYGGSTRDLEEDIKGMGNARYHHIVFFGSEAARSAFEHRGQVIVLPRPGGQPKIRLHSLILVVRIWFWILLHAWHNAVVLKNLLPRTRQILAFCSILEEHKIELVHLVNGPFGNSDAIAAASVWGIPVMGNLQSFLKVNVLDRWCFGQCRQLIAVSAAIRHSYVDQGIDPTRIAIILESLAEEEFQPASVQRDEKAQGPVVGMIGRIADWKGQDIFVAAAGYVAKQFPESRFLIIGAVDPGQENYFSSLQHSITTNCLEGKVTFSGFRKDVRSAMANVDVVVHASKSPEPAGRVILEAMACGKPVVATDAGGVPEYLVDGETGLLVPPGNPEALAEAICRLLSDTTFSRKMGEAGLARAKTNFVMKRKMEEVNNVIIKILGVNENA